MTYDLESKFTASDRTAAIIAPPPNITESGWDILLALHADHRLDLSLRKLASVVGVPDAVMVTWLRTLEERELIVGVQHPSTGATRATLTRKGRVLLDRYISVSNDLQVSTHHGR